ncbi:MAG: hypothetical protein J0M12_11400 [Deltaproteobacteria bacterium]|nr:hypothetical protein [Deltaproteobacteria bacterium]
MGLGNETHRAAPTDGRAESASSEFARPVQSDEALLYNVLAFTAAVCRIPGARQSVEASDPKALYTPLLDCSPPELSSAFSELLSRGVITKAEAAFAQSELRRFRQETFFDAVRATPTLEYPRNISPQGLPETQIWRMLELLIASNRCQVTSGEAFARPVTGTHALPAEVVRQLSTRLKPNLPLTFAYNGVWDAVEAAGDCFLGLANHPSPAEGGAVVLKSATQSLQQALHLYRSAYFAKHGVSIDTVGIAGAATLDIPRPAILAPVNSTIVLSKAAALVGYGKDDIFLYELDEHYQADEGAVRETVERIHRSGRRIVTHLAVAGDAERGIAHDVQRLDQVVSEKCVYLGYRPPVVVDAAAQWLNFFMSEQSSAWDFRSDNDNIRAIIVDPQKIELPYDLSLLLLRDYRDLSVLVDHEQCPQPDKRFLLAQANNILSRGGEAVVAAYFYMLNQGLEGLRESRLQILAHSRMLADFIRHDPRYSLITEPQGSVIAWRLNSPDPLANWRFAQRMNAQREDKLLLSYNLQCRVRTAEELGRALRGDRSFDGIVAHFMEHNSARNVEYLIDRLKNDIA